MSVDKPVLIGQSANFRVHAPSLEFVHVHDSEEEERRKGRNKNFPQRECVCRFRGVRSSLKKGSITLLVSTIGVASLPIVCRKESWACFVFWS